MATKYIALRNKDVANTGLLLCTIESDTKDGMTVRSALDGTTATIVANQMTVAGEETSTKVEALWTGAWPTNAKNYNEAVAAIEEGLK